MAQNEILEWTEISAATIALAAQSAGVVGLRAAKATRGGPWATEEAWRMYSEKFIALAELQASFFTGSLGVTPAGVARGTLKHYHRKVVANRRRLSKS